MAQARGAQALPDTAAVFRIVAGRYGGANRFTRHYVGAKLRGDPVHAAVLALGHARRLGTVLDIGCGRGQLALALLVAGVAGHVTGMDRDAAALHAARTAAGALPFLAVAHDLAAETHNPLPLADCVLMVDVLYQLDTPAQRRLLASAMLAAREMVVLRTLDPDRGLRSRIGIGLERLALRRWPHSGSLVNPRPVAELCGALAQGDFTAAVTPCWAGTPLANVLVVAHRTPTPDDRQHGSFSQACPNSENTRR